jgi:hypothetical protein
VTAVGVGYEFFYFFERKNDGEKKKTCSVAKKEYAQSYRVYKARGFGGLGGVKDTVSSKLARDEWGWEGGGMGIFLIALGIYKTLRSEHSGQRK